jgi:hypothetical protein
MYIIDNDSNLLFHSHWWASKFWHLVYLNNFFFLGPSIRKNEIGNLGYIFMRKKKVYVIILAQSQALLWHVNLCFTKPSYCIKAIYRLGLYLNIRFKWYNSFLKIQFYIPVTNIKNGNAKYKIYGMQYYGLCINMKKNIFVRID